VWRPEDGATGK